MSILPKVRSISGFLVPEMIDECFAINLAYIQHARAKVQDCYLVVNYIDNDSKFSTKIWATI